MESSTKSLPSIFDLALLDHVRHATHIVPRESRWHSFILLLIFNDLLMSGLAFRCAYWVRFHIPLPIFRQGAMSELHFYRNLSFALVVIWVLIFALYGLYYRGNLLDGVQEYALIFRCTSTGILLVIVLGFLEPAFIFARGWLLLAWGLAFFFVTLGRFTLRRVVYALRKRGYFLSRALIVGANDEGRLLAEQLHSWRTSGLHLIGFVDGTLPPETPIQGNLSVVGGIGSLDQLIEKYGIEELILVRSAFHKEEMVDLFRRFGMTNGLTVRFSSGLFEIITTGMEVKEMASVPLVRVNKVRLTGADRIIKLLLDYSICIPAVLFILPLSLLMAIAIKLDSAGPLIYRRRVMGLNGEQFDAYKYRTMHLNGDAILAQHPRLRAELARNHKLKVDPRVTRVGRTLRRYSLDELPQLLNVLKRDMSLVGPRIISPEEMTMYDQWAMNLLTVSPGITGLWQISGRSDISYDERVRLDMHYIRNWSIWLDLRILCQTIPAVLKGRGAY
jgi:exopolysaccharide biosynthesis polyprenyl glycosylphosphotransferase